MNISSTLEQMHDDGNWSEVFKYGRPIRTLGDTQTSTVSFDLDDVVAILGSCDGYNDGPSWLAVGCLKDGRVFYIEASCDYTGWG